MNPDRDPSAIVDAGPAAGPADNPASGAMPDPANPAVVDPDVDGDIPAAGDPVEAQHVVLLSGLSGAGKTAAAKLFEDLGYAVVDNLPGELLPELAELVADDRERFRKVAIVLDVRSGDAPMAFGAMRGALEGRGIRPQVFFLEARDEVLIRRFSETRHRHPLADQRGIASSIVAERRLLDPVRSESDVVIDTSDLPLRELRERIFTKLGEAADPSRLAIQLISFGFKYGVPLEADLVFDVRFMQNPYYIDELRQLSGLTAEVRAFVLGQPVAQEFLRYLHDFLGFALPAYVGEGKNRLTVALGCTGGYHRSIALTEALADWLRDQDFGPVAVFHRELDRT
jgi:RNase adapter protein RapZ